MQRRCGIVHSITVAVFSVDFERRFRYLVPELLPEFDHPRKLDDFWFGIRGNVEFMPFGIFVGVVVPADSSIVECTAWARCCLPVVELVGPPGGV